MNKGWSKMRSRLTHIFLNQTFSRLQCLGSGADSDPGLKQFFFSRFTDFFLNEKISWSFLNSLMICYDEVNHSEIWKFILKYYLFTILISVESNIFGYGCYFAPWIRLSGFLRVRTPYPVHCQSFKWLSFKSRWYLRLNIYSL